MNRHRVLAAILIIMCSLLAIGNVAFAAAAKKQNHLDGRRLVAAKLKTDGHHVLDKRGHYAASVSYTHLDVYKRQDARDGKQTDKSAY